MKRLVLLLLASLTLALLGSGCGDLGELDIDVEALIQELRAADENAEKPLSNAEELQLRQAGASDEYIDSLRRSRALVNEGLETRDPAPIREAVGLRPYDVTPRLYEWALMIAYNNDAEARSAGAAIADILYPDDRPIDEVQDTYTQYALLRRGLEALARTMPAFDAGSAEWTRLNEAYCSNLGRYQALASALEAEFGANSGPGRFSSATCP